MCNRVAWGKVLAVKDGLFIHHFSAFLIILPLTVHSDGSSSAPSSVTRRCCSFTPRLKHQDWVREPCRTPHFTLLLAKLRAWSRQRWDHLSAAVQSVNSLSFVILRADLGVQQPRRESRRTQPKQTHSQSSDKMPWHTCARGVDGVDTNERTREDAAPEPVDDSQAARGGGELRYPSLPRQSLHSTRLWLNIIHSA